MGQSRGIGVLRSPTVGRPEIDDEVLVAFEHGDARQPYVIGSLWSGGDAPERLASVAKVQLPTGGSLHAIPGPIGDSSECAAASSLLHQTAPWLASMDCVVRILRLLEPLIDVINNLPSPPAAAVREFSKAAADLAPCLLVPTPASATPVVRDVLCLVQQSLKCLLERGEPVPADAATPLQGIIALAGTFFTIAGVAPVQLSVPTTTLSLQNDIAALQVLIDALGGCGS